MNSKRLNNLIDALLKIKTKKEMRDFLKGILTYKGLDEIPTRLAIVKRLKKGVPQHKLAKQLGVGVSTVTRGSKEIKKGRFKNI